jgi:hypothetical protein
MEIYHRCAPVRCSRHESPAAARDLAGLSKSSALEPLVCLNWAWAARSPWKKKLLYSFCHGGKTRFLYLSLREGGGGSVYF